MQRYAVLMGVAFLSCAALAMVGCSDSGDEPKRAFYEWRSEFSYSSEDRAMLDSAGVDRIYVRFFDVDWSSERVEPVPESMCRSLDKLPGNVEVVPTVYITNEVFRNIGAQTEIDTLASRIARKIEELADDADIKDVSEWQLDCDWTGTTQTPYFSFVRSIRNWSPDVVLSATIRLHQVKYRAETGVPPVDRGMLMVYNTGDVTVPSESNSIFREEAVRQYTGSIDEYALPLDVALPVFSWAVRFHHGRFASILDNVGASDVNGIDSLRPLEGSRWLAIGDIDEGRIAMERGDVIRIEQPDPTEVMAVARDLANDVPSNSGTVALYRFDPLILQRYEPTYCSDLFSLFE